MSSFLYILRDRDKKKLRHYCKVTCALIGQAGHSACSCIPPAGLHPSIELVVSISNKLFNLNE